VRASIRSATGEPGPVKVRDEEPTAFERVQSFVSDVKHAGSLAEIGDLLSGATRAFAFDYYAMTQRYGLRIEGAPVQLSDYPEEWVDFLKSGSFWADDPVLAACQRSVAPFAWDDLSTIIDVTPKQAGYMQVAAAQGLARGWTVPIHIPGEATGLCSFVLSTRRDIPKDSLPAAQYLACFAFEAARRLAARGTPPLPRLTKRQLECVVLAAKGKSDWVAGQILGLAPDTVHKYLEQAKARFGVSSRTELVVRALYDGQLSFGDLLG
jgi:LuxR family quorum-sensing system transcriptional regulator CciR